MKILSNGTLFTIDKILASFGARTRRGNGVFPRTFQTALYENRRQQFLVGSFVNNKVLICLGKNISSKSLPLRGRNFAFGAEPSLKKE